MPTEGSSCHGRRQRPVSARCSRRVGQLEGRKEEKKERESVGGWVVVRVCVWRERERERKRPEYARWRERERQAANKELTYAPASTAQHIEGRMNAIQVQITK